MTYILPFSQLGKTDLRSAGGKGANLGEMTQAGLPVPPGFVLLTAAYRSFVAEYVLQTEIERLAGQVVDPAGAEAASAAIRPLFDRGPIPTAIAEPIKTAYRELGGGRVAVRSSATAEDLPGASFAGQQESYLNVEGEEQLLEAVRRCWSSLWTGRAIAYRLRQGIPAADLALAVVIQRQVEAESAGVLFTANPVSGRRDQMVIDGAWGLGEAVVSGQVTPDRWVVDGQTGTVVEIQVARKLVMTTREWGQTVTRPVPDDWQEQPVLAQGQIADLVDLGRRTAQHFGGPQDIEWAWADGQVHLVQSRPVTSLFPLPAPEPDPGLGLRIHLSANILQGFVEPFTPSGIGLFRSIAEGPARLLGYPTHPGQPPAAFRVAAGRIYLDLTDAVRHPRTRPAIMAGPSLLDQQSSEILQALVAREDVALAPAPGKGGLPVRPPLTLLLAMIGRLVHAFAAPDAARERTLAQAESLLTALEEEAARLNCLESRLHFLAHRSPAFFVQLFPRWLPPVVVGQVCRFRAESLLERWLGVSSGMQRVLRSLPHNPTTEMDLALWRLSRQLLAEGVEPTADHPGVVSFLSQYGHRGLREIDVGMARWRDEPEHVLSLLRTYLTHDPTDDAEAHFRRGMADAEVAVGELVTEVRRRRGPIRAAGLRFLLARVRWLAGVREYPKFYLVRFIALCRQVLLGAGAELVAQGRLDRAEDIFFLDLADLRAGEADVPGATDLRARAAQNRATYVQELERRAVPRVITSLGECLYTAPSAVEGALQGTAASPGAYEGRVRVVHDPRQAALEPGEILVAPGTDPAWTPLFLTAGALVMEIGGIMSHGSVVAREYGIPAVVGVMNATTLLQTGQRVRVDGESGRVIPLEKEES